MNSQLDIGDWIRDTTNNKIYVVDMFISKDTFFALDEDGGDKEFDINGQNWELNWKAPKLQD